VKTREDDKYKQDEAEDEGRGKRESVGCAGSREGGWRLAIGDGGKG
jgi:hypothetical protein